MILDLSTETTNAYATQISTASLGDHSYIVVVGGEAVAIDIQRDLDRFEDVFTNVDATLVAVLETHIHNDYVSGGKRLADLHDAEYVLPANTGAPYPHRPLPDGESLAVGAWTIRAMHTPGHTFNHTSYVLESPEGPVAIFTGGSMLVGAVGRSDLLGPDHTDALLAHQFASAHRIADTLPAPSLVAPTHGTGSFCSASDVADTTSTVGLELQRNPALLAPNVEVFSTSQVLGYKAFPAYYQYMAPANLTPLGAAPESSLPTVTSLTEIDEAAIADVRPFIDFAAGHLRGSISVPMSNDTAVYLGWTLAWNQPLAIVGSVPDVSDARTQLARIGWDNVVGRIDPGDLAKLSHGDLATTAFVTWANAELEGATILDVRDGVEHADGILPAATAVHFADFAHDPDRYVDGDVVIHCQSGYRASVAAGFAETAGADVTVILDDLKNCSEPLVKPAA
jgi:glyoxylase-like metal-dependent hydrolase (beta-lactamase superfamily II)/rhodanese-related sulfurtransferase